RGSGYPASPILGAGRFMTARFAAFARHRTDIVPHVPQPIQSWGTEDGTAQTVAAEQSPTPVPHVPLVPHENDVSGNENGADDELSVDIRKLWNRVVQREVERGADRALAVERALPLVRARLLNSPRMMLPANLSNSCAVCGLPETSASRLLPVMSPGPGRHVWLHAGDCHMAYRRELAAKVDAAMIKAGLPDSRDEPPW
ncbi:MAG TPA: hypothetical protein VK968_03490, partial [Roseimicrobium sp.]|nr:hypothetical protein [Roseimicrobium sp.]